MKRPQAIIATALGIVAFLPACDRGRSTSATLLTRAQIAPGLVSHHGSGPFNTLRTNVAEHCDTNTYPTPDDGLAEPAGLGGCPPGMAPILAQPGRCIDRWEAFVVEIGSDGRERPVSPFFHPTATTLRAKSAPGAIPQAYIDEKTAASACELAGKRLCSDEEWVAACRGADGRAFPYGKTERAGVCNDHRAHNAALEDLDAPNATAAERLQHPCVNQQADTLIPTGTRRACSNPEGVFDLVGNLHEWTAHTRAAESDGDHGAFRGGFYGDTTANGQGCGYVTTAHERTYWELFDRFPMLRGQALNGQPAWGIRDRASGTSC